MCNVTAAETFHVCDTLTVGPQVTVSPPNGNLTLRAFNRVVFTNDVTIGGAMTVRND